MSRSVLVCLLLSMSHISFCEPESMTEFCNRIWSDIGTAAEKKSKVVAEQAIESCFKMRESVKNSFESGKKSLFDLRVAAEKKPTENFWTLREEFEKCQNKAGLQNALYTATQLAKDDAKLVASSGGVFISSLLAKKYIPKKCFMVLSGVALATHGVLFANFAQTLKLKDKINNALRKD
jgi:hypothetical protein